MPLLGFGHAPNLRSRQSRSGEGTPAERRIETFIRSASAISIVITLDPPYEKSGSVTPTTGQHARHHAEVDDRVPEDDRRDADASTAPKRSLRLRRDADRPEHEEPVEADERRRSPTKPHSSAKTGNGKSVYWSGRKPNWFCVPFMKPWPKSPPSPMATRAWCACQPAPRAGRPRGSGRS